MTDPLAVLTPHQRKVAILISEGWALKEVAYRMGCTVKTLETFLSRTIYPRLGVYNRFELAYLVLTGRRAPSARRVPEAADA